MSVGGGTKTLALSNNPGGLLHEVNGTQNALRALVAKPRQRTVDPSVSMSNATGPGGTMQLRSSSACSAVGLMMKSCTGRSSCFVPASAAAFRRSHSTITLCSYFRSTLTGRNVGITFPTSVAKMLPRHFEIPRFPVSARSDCSPKATVTLGARCWSSLTSPLCCSTNCGNGLVPRESSYHALWKSFPGGRSFTTFVT